MKDENMKQLTPNIAFNLLIEDIIKTPSDFNKEENRWIKHSLYVGISARRIAKRLNLDEDLAEVLGYIHDIGRKIDHFNHPIAGYFYMLNLGYFNYARICLTHSFIDNDINLTAGGGPKRKERYEFISTFLEHNPPTIYDNIIQLCDLFCLETGFTTIEKRLLDITLRKGIFNNSFIHYQKTIELKEKIEDLMNCQLYSLFEEINKEDLDNYQNIHSKLLSLIKR